MRATLAGFRGLEPTEVRRVLALAMRRAVLGSLELKLIGVNVQAPPVATEVYKDALRPVVVAVRCCSNNCTDFSLAD